MYMGLYKQILIMYYGLRCMILGIGGTAIASYYSSDRPVSSKDKPGSDSTVDAL